MTKDRTFLVPLHRQTSQMDCGPAALCSLLNGLGEDIAIGDVRKRCLSGADGTSIDQLEEYCQELGLFAEQQICPVDRDLFVNANLPAIVITKSPSGLPHFVVVWRAMKEWLQVMDPSIGRRWVSRKAFLNDLYIHRLPVRRDEWQAWSNTPAFCAGLEARFHTLGVKAPPLPSGAIERAHLDASLRFVSELASKLTAKSERQALFNLVMDHPEALEDHFWRVRPLDDENLWLAGAVVLRVQPKVRPGHPLRTARRKTTAQPAESEWTFFLNALGRDKTVLIGAAIVMAATSLIVVGQMLVFRSLFNVAWLLNLASQRVIALAVFIALVSLSSAMEIPLVSQSFRLGRKVELKIRMALAEAIARLPSSYARRFTAADMAERGHSLYITRLLPGLLIHGVQIVSSLIATSAAIAWLDIACLPWALALIGITLLVSIGFQGLVTRQDLNSRQAAAIVHHFQVDTLLGLQVIRAQVAQSHMVHRFQKAIIDWRAAGRAQQRTLFWLNLCQALLTSSLAILVLWSHFARERSIQGGDILLVYWTLRLPAMVGELTHLLQSISPQVNVLKRARELVMAAPQPQSNDLEPLQDVAISINEVSVTEGNIKILEPVSLSIPARQHVAIVGLSGAGKSTLLRTIIGLSSYQSGEIRVGNTSLAGCLTELRSATAWVDPEVMLWDDSLMRNIQNGHPAPCVSKLSAVIEGAGLKPTVARLSDGLESKIGENGAFLSAGEAQRLRFARALYQSDVALALLDEPFRGMSREEGAKLMQVGRAHWCNATVICVSHDMALASRFDRVIVMKDGKIVEDGKPEHLLGETSHFAQMFRDEIGLEQRAASAWRAFHLDRPSIDGAEPMTFAERPMSRARELFGDVNRYKLGTNYDPQ